MHNEKEPKYEFRGKTLLKSKTPLLVGISFHSGATRGIIYKGNLYKLDLIESEKTPDDFDGYSEFADRISGQYDKIKLIPFNMSNVKEVFRYKKGVEHSKIENSLVKSLENDLYQVIQTVKTPIEISDEIFI